jgi:hypothetical protein
MPKKKPTGLYVVSTASSNPINEERPMYFDYLTLAGLFSAISLAGILYGMASQDISRRSICLERACCGGQEVE